MSAVARAAGAALSALLVAVPLLLVVGVTAGIAQGGTQVPGDFFYGYYSAAEALLGGESPYPESIEESALAQGAVYAYPPLLAVLAVPFTVLPVETAGVLFMILLAASVVGTLLALDVRDWRCYGLAFVWPPVFNAIHTGNVTTVLGLCVALVWRYRGSARLAGSSLGLGLAAKLLLWPIAVWLAAVGRVRVALWGVAVGLALALAPWAAIGFVGLEEYPSLLRRVSDLQGGESYTVYALALDLGAGPDVARALWLLVAGGLLAASVVVARRGDERKGFVLVVVAVIACSPIVWLHYFALLLVAVAVVEPRLGPAWFIPLAMYASAEAHNGTTFQTALALVSAAATVAVALRFGPPVPTGAPAPPLSRRPA